MRLTKIRDRKKDIGRIRQRGGCALLITAMLLTGCGADKTGQDEITAPAQQENMTERSARAEDSAREEEAVILRVTEIDGNTITAELGSLQSEGIMPSERPGGEAPEGMPSERPDGEAPEGMPSESPGGETPEGMPSERPDGEAPEGMPSESPDGEAPEGMPSERPDGGAPEGMPSERLGGEAPEGMPSERPGGEAPEEMPSGDGMPPQRSDEGMPGGSVFSSAGETITFTLTEQTKITVEFLQGSSDGTAEDIAVGSVLAVTFDASGNAETVTVKNLQAGGGFGGSSEVTNGTAANTLSEDAAVTQESYSSSGDDENALRIDGATVTLSQIEIFKSGGESSNTENGDFYGQNAGLLALNGAQVTIENAAVETNAVNGNGVFSYGEDTVVRISDSVIRTNQSNSGGIQTTGGGTTIAENLDIETQGTSSAAIRSDRGGGTVRVTGGSYVTNGTGSPAVYCTADIQVEDAVLTANASESIVVEGKNSVSVKNCTLTSTMKNTYLGNGQGGSGQGDEDENIHGIMIYQSMSGDADLGEAHFSAEGGSIAAQAGDFIYVTNTDCTIELTNVACSLVNNVFLRVEGNSSSRGWGTQGANGGDVVMKASSQEINGNILVDEISSLELTLTENSSMTGAVNPSGEAGNVAVSLDDSSVWNLTEDSYITSFEGELSQINTNGHHLYVDGKQVL